MLAGFSLQKMVVLPKDAPAEESGRESGKE